MSSGKIRLREHLEKQEQQKKSEGQFFFYSKSCHRVVSRAASLWFGSSFSGAAPRGVGRTPRRKSRRRRRRRRAPISQSAAAMFNDRR